MFRLHLKLNFDVSVSNQTGRRLDMQSCLATLGTFCARMRVFKRFGSCFSISEMVFFGFFALSLEIEGLARPEERRE